jgi:hypothetical protein
MDDYQNDDCFFVDQVFPHVINQCQCFNNITIVPDDVVDLWFQVRDEVNAELYNGQLGGPWYSCDSANQAMVWLSSGNTRDAGDLFQRFITALSFVQMNGTQWDSNNLWLSDDSECLWYGLQCDDRFQINSLALDVNNVL